MSTRTVATVAALVGLGLAACGGARWEIIQQAPHNPLAGATQYYVAPVNFDGITIEGKPEPEWMAGRSPEQQASWQNDKAVYARELVHQLSGAGTAMVAKGRSYQLLEGAPPAGAFVLAVHFVAMDQDHVFEVSVFAGAKRLVDQVRFPLKNAGSGFIMGFAPRLMNSRAALAERLDRYLRDRANEAADATGAAQ